MSNSEERRNEKLFRMVNEEIESHATDTSMEFLCECGNSDCTQQIPVPASDYARIRENDNWFVVWPEHVHPDIERVVEEHEGWTVVKKTVALN